MDGNSQDQSNRAAARWYARLNAANCSEQERAQFEAWRESDPRNAAAFARAEQLGRTLARVATVDPRLKAMLDRAASAGATLPDDPEEDDDAPPSGGTIAAHRRPVAARWRRAQRWAAAAAAVVTAAVGALLATGFERPHENGVAERVDLRYAAGSQQRVVALDDGTVVHLDVASVIEIRFASARRDVLLIQGRALFDVAHDATRPFIVTARAEQVTALGTVFQVDRTTEQLVVTLAEGAVSVAANGDSAAPVRLEAGEQLQVPPDAKPWIKLMVDTRSVTSWSASRHVFRETPWADAIEEINRSSP
jgi:transmembrane sensor